MISYMDAVEDLARITGEAALGFFGKRISVDQKADGSPVSEADRSAETVAREWIAKRFPHDTILGEEFGRTDSGSKLTWVIDPIDGTRTFLRGVPFWGTLVAVAQGENVLAGAAFLPALGEMVVAAPGEGCWLNARRTKVSPVSNLIDAAILTTDERFFKAERADRWHDLTRRCGIARTWGDTYGYVLVATGRAEAMVDVGLSPWDTAALRPIVEEAGGSLTDWNGTPVTFSADIIATNSALARQIRHALGVQLERVNV